MAPTQDFDPVPESFRVPYTWLDGELISSDQAMVPVMTLTLHYGLGVFEGIRAYDGEQGPAVFRLREHVERLFTSGRLVKMAIPFTVDEVVAACQETLGRNGLREGYIRPLGFVDDGRRGLAAPRNRVRLAIVVWPWGAYLGDDGIKHGIRAMVSSWTRMSGRSFLPKGKICGQYVNSIMAKRDAVASGFDEAIMLDDAGFIAEATGENIFLVDSGRIRTPPKSAPILAGITRDSVMELARREGLEVHEERITRESLYAADEVFMTGTAAEVTPVREVDHRPIGTGTRGPVTEKLQSAYMDAVRGRIPDLRHWLAPYETS